MNQYMLTITRDVGLTRDQTEKLRDWFDKNYQMVLFTIEPHKSGLMHAHAVVRSDVKSGGSIHKKLTRFLLGHCGMQPAKNMLKVQSADDGALAYVVKDVTPTHPALICRGWDLADLLKCRQASLKKISQKVKGDYYVLGQAEAVPMILEFAKSDAIPITDWHSYKQVCKAMMRMGYSFSRLKFAITYAEIMCILGDDRAIDDWMDMQMTGMHT